MRKNKSFLELKKFVLDYIIYENGFFNIIPKNGYNICLFRTISYYLKRNNNLHKNVRVYNYVL